jgi:dihydrofolate synthase/folylpolyglutamate synthase
VPAVAAWFVTQGSADRGASGDELGALLETRGATTVNIAADIAGAVAAARAAAGHGDRVLVFGSFVTVGSAMEALRLYCAPSQSVDRPTTWIRA